MTNVIGCGLLAPERKNMAADGDMFVQRKAWGYNRLCAAVCDNAPTERLVEIEAQNVRNMLANGFAVPSFKVSIQRAFDILESADTELGFESAGHFEEQAFALERALRHKNPWFALANDFPELYEIEHSITLSGEDEKEVRKSLLQLLQTQVSEWKGFSGRAALNRHLIAA